MQACLRPSMSGRYRPSGGYPVVTVQKGAQWVPFGSRLAALTVHRGAHKVPPTSASTTDSQSPEPFPAYSDSCGSRHT